MQANDRENFFALLTDAMAFYGQELSAFASGVWWQACSGYELEVVVKAFTRHAMDPDRGQFPPKPADIVRQLSGTSTDKAMLAWGKAFDAASRVGAYTDVVFDDPAIHAAIDDLGGWPKFCRTEASELSYLQHRFSESYRAYVGREKFDFPRRLGGDRSPDDVYSRRGLPPPKPAVIGDVEAARAVYRLGSKSGKTSVMHQALEAIERGPALLPADRTAMGQRAA
jgi:hypothetical protein